MRCFAKIQGFNKSLVHGRPVHLLALTVLVPKWNYFVNPRLHFSSILTSPDWKLALKQCQKPSDVENVLRNASVNNIEAQFSLGLFLLSPTTPIVEMPKESNPEIVRADIAKVRKATNSKRGSKSDFDKAKKLRDSKLQGTVTAPKALIVDKSVNTSPSQLEINKTEGTMLIKQAALGGHADAMCYLGNTLLNSGLDNSSIETVFTKTNKVRQAIDWYLKAANTGCAEAAFNLGVIYHDGVSVDPPSLIGESNEESEEAGNQRSVSVVDSDLIASLGHFESASALGEYAASLWCGYCYSSGEGGAGNVDVQKAIAFLEKALSSTSTAAKSNFYLSELYRSGHVHETESNESFVMHLKRAVELRDEDALYSLADLHLHEYMKHEQEERASAVGEGEEGENTALLNYLMVDLSNIGASACHSHSTSFEGCTHFAPADRGEGKEEFHLERRHLTRSIALLQEASALGQANATLTLGALVYQGVIIEDNHHNRNLNQLFSFKRRAFELYNLAAEQGSLEAWRNIASMHYLGDGIPKCENTAREIMRVMFPKK